MTLEMLKPGLVQSGTPLPLPEPLFPRIQLKQKEPEKPGRYRKLPETRFQDGKDFGI